MHGAAALAEPEFEFEIDEDGPGLHRARGLAPPGAGAGGGGRHSNEEEDSSNDDSSSEDSGADGEGSDDSDEEPPETFEAHGVTWTRCDEHVQEDARTGGRFGGRFTVPNMHIARKGDLLWLGTPAAGAAMPSQGTHPSTSIDRWSMPPPPDPRTVHEGAANVSLTSLGWKPGSQRHCVVCGGKTTCARNRCMVTPHRCAAVHPPRGGSGGRAGSSIAPGRPRPRPRALRRRKQGRRRDLEGAISRLLLLTCRWHPQS